VAAKLIINLKKKKIQKYQFYFLLSQGDREGDENERFTFASSSVMDGTIIQGVSFKTSVNPKIM
jgi:hypothetical protein